MKIVCESCGAKYSIADEKVAGKVFKIRCKKCSAVIVVKGDQQEEGGEEATRVFDYGAEAVWHVVVGSDQQGPLAPRQIGELLTEGKIDWEAYVWREGMDGWQPAKDVEALVSSVMAESEGRAAPKATSAAGGGGAQVFGGSSDMGADPFAAADDGGLSGVMAQSAATSAGGGADLFAQSARSPFSGASDDEERASSGSSPRTSESQAMTGQRNENSVLFSLSNLQALATGSGAPPATNNRPKGGMAQGEGSGLIDIRALANATQAVADKPNGGSKESVEDLLAVGAAGSTFNAASLATPVAQEKTDNSKLVLGGMAAAILLLGGAVGFLALREPAAPATAAIAPVTQAATPAAQAAAVAPAPVEPQPAQAAAAGEEEAPRANESEREREEREQRNERRRSRSSGDSAKTASKTSEPPPSTSAAPTAKPSSSGDKSLEDLLDSALSGKPGKTEKSAAATGPKSSSETIPASPGRDDVLSAMKSVTSRVQACGNGQSGVAMTKVGVAGPTGRVTSAEVSGQFAGTPVAACIAREVGKARFPKFSNPTFSFNYPFKL